MRPNNRCKSQFLLLVLPLLLSGSVWAQERPPSPERLSNVSDGKVVREEKADGRKKAHAEGDFPEDKKVAGNPKPAQPVIMRLLPARNIAADRKVSIWFRRDNRLRLAIASASSETASEQVTRYLEALAKTTLPKLYAHCEFSDSQVKKQAMAARAEIKSIAYAVRILEAELRGKSLVDAEVVRRVSASLSEINTRIDECFDAPESLFRKVLLRQLSERQLSLYEQYQTLKFDKLSSFVAAISRLAVLSPEKSRRLAAMMEVATVGQTPRTFQDCANTFLSPSTQESAAKILAQSELASANRLSHYHLRAK